MRDAFGGVFMMRLMLVFVFIFVAFTAISLNYAKAFRIKNSVIDFVEQQEIMDLDKLFQSAGDSRLKILDGILDKAKYNKECQNVDSNGKISREAMDGKAYCYRGIIIEQSELIDRTIVYNVYTYADWNLGALNMILALGGRSRNSEHVINGSWEISGEARVVKRNYDHKRSWKKWM